VKNVEELWLSAAEFWQNDDRGKQVKEVKKVKEVKEV